MNTILPFFLKYLLAPFLILIITLIMSQFSNVKIKTKAAIIFTLCFSIIAALPCLFAFFNNEFIWFGLLFSVIYYIILGIALVYFMNTALFQKVGIQNNVLAKVFLFLIIAILSSWIYYLVFNYIAISSYAHISMLNILWLFVPIFFQESKNKYLQIPEPFYEYWRVGKERKDFEYWDNIDKFRLMQVSIHIRKKANSEFFSKFDVKIAQDVNLGSWFDKFIEDQNYRFPNDAIESSAENEDTGWTFYTAKYFSFPLFIKNLSPYRTISESKLKNKQTIFAKRVALNRHENGLEE
ncbi:MULTISPECIES: TssN family type VI secretion system protein [Flavobacterium]|uniref:TssN family type VI secretion system protein n=1 Tax=Flavobacterium lipolyticum TaxID=2893754 RepID=A0ABS8M8Q2_9FLAO|nr:MULTISPECIES: TssN family type VI secretion system protein [unclassified Flavobacterium]MCC9020603.1 TssN family type VI secretion system protein [Flavobacterium sp. F-126]